MIKSIFHKVIKNINNDSLKKVDCNKLFDFLKQSFIANITIKLNNIASNYTYEEIIYNRYFFKNLKLNQNSKNIDKYNSNIDVQNFLDKNPKI